jgi:hypothetical protein
MNRCGIPEGTVNSYCQTFAIIKRLYTTHEQRKFTYSAAGAQPQRAACVLFVGTIVLNENVQSVSREQRLKTRLSKSLSTDVIPQYEHKTFSPPYSTPKRNIPVLYFLLPLQKPECQ